MKPGILGILINSEGFVSGEALGEEMGVTRAALWKRIKALKEDGAVIEASAGKGYKLISPPEVPRAEYVKAYMKYDAEVFYRDRAISTNDDAREAAKDTSIKSGVFIAGEQLKGRGRKGRQWISPFGGLYMTFLARPKLEPHRIPGITVMAAVSLCRALEKAAGISPEIKWPNDIVLGKRKLAGILTECMIGMDGVEYAVCGMGINAGGGLKGELERKACSVEANKVLLAAAAADEFFKALDLFETDGLNCFMPEFRKRSALYGRITVTAEKEKVTGELIGFDESGALIIDCAGERRRFIVGEVSARGEGTYV